MRKHVVLANKNLNAQFEKDKQNIISYTYM